MSYIGNEPRFTQFPSKFFNGDGSAMTVTLDYAPPNKAALLVFISGVRQDTDAYTISGTSLTFTGSVPSGTDNVQVVHLGLTVQVPAPADGTVTNAKLADMAANTVKVRDANSEGVPSDKAVATTEILIGDGTGFTAAALSSDVTMTNAGAVTIADNAVTLAKMAGLVRGKIIYGDTSGDPAALTVGSANDVLTSDGTDISWAAAAGTTINNNADNRVITGSGSANTLEGEANLTFDGADLAVNTDDFFVDGSKNAVAINSGTVGGTTNALEVYGSLKFGIGDGTSDGAPSGSNALKGALSPSGAFTGDNAARLILPNIGQPGLVLVYGNSTNASYPLRQFHDIVQKGIGGGSNAFGVIQSSERDSPGARTYSGPVLEGISVAIDDSGTSYTVRAICLGADEFSHASAFTTMGDS